MSDYQFVVEVKAETDRAILINDGGDKDIWLPKSQLKRFEEDHLKPDMAAICIPEWLAVEKGML